MKKVEDKILSVIDKHRMLSDNDTVVVAVSGGADSMCLLHFFNRISSYKNLNIICAHVNHGIRGQEAARDEEFVRSFCKKNGICFKVAHYDVPAVAKKTGESEEQCGRRLRYEFFSEICKNAKIATAHNLNDCIETFIFNLSRGTGLKGLTGIPPVRDNIIRPLIECTREEIEAYLRFFGTEYVTDSTNKSDAYSRNKIRHNIIPVLKDLNSNFEGVFQGCITSLADTEEFISSTVEKVFEDAKNSDEFNIKIIDSADNIIKNRLIIKISHYFGAYDVSARHVKLISGMLQSGGAVMLPGNVTVASDGKHIKRIADKLSEIEIFQQFDTDVTEYKFPGGTIYITEVDKSGIKNYNIKQLAKLGYADGDKLTSSFFRTRIGGDRFRYPCSEHSKSLKNLFKEKMITPEDRWGIPFLADENNILWINGIGVSEYAAVTDKSENVIRITLVRS